jgi:hypothetical protein
MKYLKDLKTLLILILIGVVAVSQFKSCDTTPEGGVTHEIDTVYQEVKVEVPKYVPKWRTKIEEVEVQVQVEGPPVKIDTAEILADYFAKYKTIDTLRLKYTDTSNVERSFGYGVVTDIISRNQIIERGISWNYQIPTVYHKITIHPKPVNQVYVGVSSGFNRSQFVDNVAGGLILKTKKDNIYQASIGMGNTGSGVEPFVGAGIFWKVRLKKPKLGDVVSITK